MAHDDKDRLADLLGQMADGEHDAGHGDDPGHAHGAQPPPAARPASMTNLPTPKPTATPQAPPRVAMPGPPPPVPPRNVVSPPQPVPAARPGPVPPAQAPGAPAGAFTQASGEPVDEDDAVIVPAPPVSALAHSQAYRPPTRPESGLSLGLRRTMIPILLTLGIEMFALLVLGALSPRDATFSMFIKPGIAIMLAVLGLLFLPAGLFLMFQVRNELSRRPPG